MDIRLIDMHLRDERTLNFLKANMNPTTRRVEGLTQPVIGAQVQCSVATVNRIIRRLEGAGYLIRISKGQHDGSILEISCKGD